MGALPLALQKVQRGSEQVSFREIWEHCGHLHTKKCLVLVREAGAASQFLRARTQRISFHFLSAGPLLHHRGRILGQIVAAQLPPLRKGLFCPTPSPGNGF